MEEYFKLVVADESSSKDAREKIWQGLLKLALTYLDNAPVHAEGLLERMYTITCTSITFGEKWPLRMSMMANVLLVWSEFIPLREKALAYLHKEAPAHWHDFSLAYWLACLPATDEEVDPAWNQVLSMCKDAPLSQAWFLTTLLRRGKEDAAFRLARLSPYADALLKRLRRGLLLMGSARAAELIQKEDMAEDPLGSFLLLPSIDERVAYLREQTANGTKPLPAKLWSAPNIMEFLQTSSTDPSQGGMLVLYTRTEKPENMFKEYLRMHAFGQYNYEDFDPNLLAVLVAWDDAYPEEFKQETELMWKAMKPAIVDVSPRSGAQRRFHALPDGHGRPPRHAQPFVRQLGQTNPGRQAISRDRRQHNVHLLPARHCALPLYAFGRAKSGPLLQQTLR